jgi:hypothetical protein
MGHANMLEMDDFTATSAARSAQTAYTMAGLGPDDMELALLYDSFTITAAITAEMLGLAPRGEGHLLWKDGHAAPGGRLPINTNGGGLSFNHSGMYGMPLLIEGYRQLSGTAEDGVNGDAGKQTSAKTCVINGTGGTLSTTGTLVLIAGRRTRKDTSSQCQVLIPGSLRPTRQEIQSCPGRWFASRYRHLPGYRCLVVHGDSRRGYCQGIICRYRFGTHYKHHLQIQRWPHGNSLQLV